MLTSIRIKNVRSYEDSGPIPMSRLNVLLGANNAGKSALMSAIQLAAQSCDSRARGQPLALEAQPQFSSFDSFARMHWSPNVRRPSTFGIHFGWAVGPLDQPMHIDAKYLFAGNADDGHAFVKTARYSLNGKDGASSVQVYACSKSRGEPHYHFSGLKPDEAEMVGFRAGIPMIPYFRSRQASKSVPALVRATETLASAAFRLSRRRVVVVMPYRPIPRSLYVVDDPSMTGPDREFLSKLIRIWASTDADDQQVQQRIKTSIQKLGVASNFTVRKPVTRGFRLAEVRVATQRVRQMVTIADVGYGVSQVLPLVVEDALLANGFLVAYQPEVHLHPFAQSRLADVFKDSAHRGNQVFIETHSPDLILRLQYLVADKQLPPDWLNVLCVENVGGKSQVTKLKFDRKGVPSPRWPRGFLDTGLQLATDISRSRAQ